VSKHEPRRSSMHDDERILLGDTSRNASVAEHRFRRMIGLTLTTLLLLTVSVVLLSARRSLILANMGSTAALPADNFKCCGRGIHGQGGICLPAQAHSVCCAGAIPLLCDSGSTCHLNSHGHPFCCAQGFTGCSNVCVLETMINSILQDGKCNDVAPQGIRTPDRVQYVDLPWDGQSKQYIFGDRNTLMDIPFPRGLGDFTIAATITPGPSVRISIGDIGIFMVRRSDWMARFVDLMVGFIPETREAFLFLGLSDAGCEACLQVPTNELIRADTPINMLWVRQNATLLIYANNTLLGSTGNRSAFNLDNSLGYPLEIGAFVARFEGFFFLAPLIANVSNIRISDTAHVPVTRPLSSNSTISI